MNFYFKYYLNVIVLIVKFQIIFPKEDKYEAIDTSLRVLGGNDVNETYPYTQRKLNVKEEEYEEIDTSFRILGGNDVKKPYPYMVSLQVGTYGHICGGSLIHQDWVLTAGHCFFEGRTQWVNKKSCRVLIGLLDLRTVTNDTITRECADYKLHSTFTLNLVRDDIAMIKVDKPVTNWEYMPLASSSTVDDALYNRAVCTVMGWGRTGDGGGASKTLKEVEVQLASAQKCRNHLGIASRFSNLCTFDEATSPCKGDSGGPLMYKGEQIGIVSYGKLCTDEIDKRPSAYCRVDYYANFIKATIAFSHKISSNHFLIIFTIFIHIYFVI